MMKKRPVALFAALVCALPAFAAEPEKPAPPKDPTGKELLAPKGESPKPEVGGYVIKTDTSDVPEMEEYAKKVQKVAEEWYPKLIPMLPSDGFKPPQTVTIVFRKDARAIAAAGGSRITAQQKWFTEHPEDLGAFVHELVHIVQQYPRGNKPGWLVEGIADYVRFFRYEPENARPKPNPTRAKHTDSYRTTGHFLNWAQEKYDKDLVVKLNAACRQAKYKEELWKEYTGKTLEELGAEWKESLQPQKK
jgi:hypothetical protein